MQSAMHGSNGDAKSVSDVEKCDVAFQNLQPCADQETYSQEPVIVKTEFGSGKKSAIFSGWTQPTIPKSRETILDSSFVLTGQAEFSFPKDLSAVLV